MKKLKWILLSILLVSLLAGCSSNKTSNVTKGKGNSSKSSSKEVTSSVEQKLPDKNVEYYVDTDYAAVLKVNADNKKYTYYDMPDDWKGKPVKHISDMYAFNCCHLKRIKLSNKLEDISELAFVNCDMEELSLGKSLITIERQAISECNNLKELDFPDTLKQIGDNAIVSCKSLKKVVFHNADVEIGAGNFTRSDKNLIIYGPAGSTAESYAKENNIKFVAQ